MFEFGTSEHLGDISYFYGKPIDITKLKVDVLSDVRKKLRNVGDQIKTLQTTYPAVQQTSCYICKDSASVPCAEVYGFTYVRCATCGHTYTTERYSEHDLLDFYKNSTFYSTQTYGNPASHQYRIDHVARPKMEFLEYFTNGKGRLLDGGSGIGDIPLVAKQSGWDATGIEVSKDSVQFGTEQLGAPLLQGSFMDHLDLVEECTLDAVTLIGFLEHTIDPIHFLQQVQTKIRPGGHIMIQVPSADSFASMIQASFPQNVFRHMVPMDHYQLFSKDSLDRALEQTGYTIRGYWFHGLDLYELMNHLSIMHPESAGTDSPLFQTFLEHMDKLQLVMDQAQKSDRIIVVAQKI